MEINIPLNWETQKTCQFNPKAKKAMSTPTAQPAGPAF